MSVWSKLSGMRSIRLFLYLVVLPIILFGPIAGGSDRAWAQSGSANSSREPAADPRYRIGPRDLIQVEVFELPELNVQRRVSSQGTVRLPVLGDFEVAGKTEAEAASALETSLEASYVERASVSIQVLEIRARSFTVIGAARQPGEYGLPGERSLLEAITAAGGLADNHGSSIHVLRRASNGLSDQLTIDIDDLLVRADPRVNIPILPNDLINVEKQASIHVYLLGEVSTPGEQSFDTTERATLLYAIARAGGLADRASPKIVIQRRGEGDEVEQIHANYKQIVAGKAPDVELEDGDVLIVKESFF